MPNLHLRNRQLSLRAKGLLCQMLSMPPEWNFTLQGLAYINKEGLDAITTVIQELEQAGYITRARVRNEKGQLREMEYTVYSSPKLNDNYNLNSPSLMTVIPGVFLSFLKGVGILSQPAKFPQVRRTTM